MAHREIDLARPKQNRKNAGFTDEERANFDAILEAGFIDTFRHFHPDKTDAHHVTGSDHCPVVLEVS